MRSLACLAVLCLAACVFHGDGLRNRAVSDAVLEQTPLPEYRQKRVAAVRHWLWKGLLVLAEHGKQLAPALFGKGPDSENELLIREESVGPGCNEEDGEVAHTALNVWMDRFEHMESDIMKELEPLMMNMTMGPMGQPSLGDMWKIQKTVNKLGKEVLHEIPGSCRNIDSLMSGDMGSMLTCMHKATNVSKKCLRCIPRFFNHLSGCEMGCMNNIESMSNEMMKVVEPMMQDLMKIRGSLPGMGGMINPGDLGDAPTPKDKTGSSEDTVIDQMQELEGKMIEMANTMIKSMSKITPCLECGRKKTDSLMGCLNLQDSWKEDVDSAIKELIDMLKSGNISISEVDEMPLQQPQQPLVPLA